jgi:hypothetical protein
VEANGFAAAFPTLLLNNSIGPYFIEGQKEVKYSKKPLPQSINQKKFSIIWYFYILHQE